MKKESVDGRLVDPRPIHFEVKESSKGQPEMIELKAYANDYASVSMKKTNKHSEALEARFALDIWDGKAWKPVHHSIETENSLLFISELKKFVSSSRNRKQCRLYSE